MSDEAPPADAPAAEGEAPPAEAAPAAEGEAAPAEGAAEGDAAPAEGEGGPPKEPMSEEEAATKIQARARGMSGRSKVENEKGYRKPVAATEGGEAAAPAGQTEEEIAAAEAARLEEEEKAKKEAEEQRKKEIDPAQCQVSGPTLLKCVAGCSSHFYIQCINGGGGAVQVPLDELKIALEVLENEEAEAGENIEVSIDEFPQGKFACSFTPRVAGHYVLRVEHKGKALGASPYKVWCVSAWKCVKLEGEPETLPQYHEGMGSAWMKDSIVLFTERNPTPDDEHSKPRLELYSMDQNRNWEHWSSYGLSDLEVDACFWPRRYPGIASLSEEGAMVLYGGVRDGKKDKDAKASDPAPQEILAEPLLITFKNDAVQLNPPKKTEGTPPPARWGHAMAPVGHTVVVFGGMVAEGDSEMEPDNGTWLLHFTSPNVWHWTQPHINGRRPLPRYRAGVGVHRKKLFIYGGIGAQGQILNDMHVLELGANPSWHTLQTVGESPHGSGGIVSPQMCFLNDPDQPACLIYGGYTSIDEEATPDNSIHLFTTDEKVWHDGGVFSCLHEADSSMVRPQCVTSSHNHVFFNFSNFTKPKLPGMPIVLDQIHQMLPAAVMKPTTPVAPHILRELGDGCVVSWDLTGTAEGDTFVNQFLLEMDFGAHGSPFVQVYTGAETSFRVKNLRPQMLYTFRVRASNGAALSEFSETCTFEAGFPLEEPAAGDEEEVDPEADGVQDDWYETFLEEERLRKEEEKVRRAAEAHATRQRRNAMREHHEQVIDQQFIALRTLDEVRDHYEQLQAECHAQIARKDGTSLDAAHRPAGGEAPRQLHKVMQDVTDRLRELEAEEDNREATREQMQTRLDHKVAAAELVHQRFHNFKREIAQEAENSRSGRKIPAAELERIDGEEHEKDEELKAVRLKNIVLKHELARLESWLQSKEVLGEGLHLIDFEQLKIENQTLNEKIEERNEELLKLRKKNTQTVQVLTHIKEKLQFVQADNQLQKDNLAHLETDLALKRDELATHKKMLDHIRHDRYKLKEKSGLVDSDDLLYDFETTKDRIEELRRQLKALQQKSKNAQELTKEVLAQQASLRHGGDDTAVHGGAPFGGELGNAGDMYGPTG